MRSVNWLSLSRLAIGLVAGFNLQCAFVFMIKPAAYAGSFELTGEPGAAAVRGIGILFLMWNIPYLVALFHPVRHSSALWEALAMQAIGVLGETLIWLNLSNSHSVLRASISRFILFDAAGLLLLGLSLLFVRQAVRNQPIRRTSPI